MRLHVDTNAVTLTRDYIDRLVETRMTDVGISYNQKLITLDEIRKIGEKLASCEPNIQVCVLDYRPEFRRRDLERPSYQEMVKVKKILEETRLKCVICQTVYEHIGP